MAEIVIDRFLDNIATCFKDGFIAITLGNYKGSNEAIKNIYISKISIKAGLVLSFTYRNKTNDIVKNYPLEVALVEIENELSNGFLMATLFTNEKDILIEKKDADWKLRELPASKNMHNDLGHNKVKNHLVASNRPYLYNLGVADKNGNVLKNAQDKFRQINHYIEVLKNELSALPTDKPISIVDMGSGKGYLTFALYDFLVNNLKKNAKVVGVEFRKDLVEICNKIARQNQFDGLRFEQSTIQEYKSKEIDVLIALHACDTATDDAIACGIKANAQLIVVAPCCHKQIRREIQKNKVETDLDFVIKHGIFLERQAEMITDSIRALYLNYHGYGTKVFEFITDAHTPKNIMIVAENRGLNFKKTEILEKIGKAKQFFGINTHYLEKAL